MKKLFYTVMITAVILLSTNFTQAQAWDKSSKVLSLGVGASSFFHPNAYGSSSSGYGYGWGYGYGYGRGRSSLYSPITGQLSLQGEFGVHKYVGVGFNTGLGGRSSWGGYGSELNVPIGAIANFHFFQLIADKTGKNIHSDKLDVYAGLNIGSGIAAYFEGGSSVGAIVWGGFQVGGRYYFTDKFGVNLEVGYGKSIVNGGIVFKL